MGLKTKLTVNLWDIRLWITVFCVLRLFAITNPPLEVAHNWRQTTVTMAARNFLETDSNILFPRVDFAGEKSGITGMEFPALNYLVYLVSLLFGYEHWYGRLINLLITSIGTFFFFKCIKRFYGDNVAFNSTILLIVSVWFNYSRKIMPDTFAMAFVFMGLYFLTEYLYSKKGHSTLFLYFVFAGIGILSKLPSGYVLSLLGLFLFDNSVEKERKMKMTVVTLLIMGVVSTYYFYWVPHLNSVYGFQHFFMGKGLIAGFSDTIGHMDQVLEKFYLEALQIIGFILFLISLVYLMVVKNKQLLLPFIVLCVGFCIIIFKAGFAFYHHSYYIIPFAPVMALVAGFGLSRLSNKTIVAVVLFAIGTESLLNKANDYFIKDEEAALIHLETELDKIGKREDLILINSGKVPTPMYFAHRKGWIADNSIFLNADTLRVMKSKGLKWVVVLKRTFGHNIMLNYKQRYTSKDFSIYEL